jgi:hypothetical protein
MRRQNRRSAAAAAGVSSVIVVSLLIVLFACASATSDAYDAEVLRDQPRAYWTMANPSGGTEPDLSGGDHDGKYLGSPPATTLPNGAPAAKFDGRGQYLEMADAAALSPATTATLTVEAWIRPDVVQFSREESSGYVHWLGKGEPEKYEYVARMYSADNAEDRPNRMSGYLFNRGGGLGAGSYFQDDIRTGEWIHYVLVINAAAAGGEYPHGYTKIFRDGVLRDQDDLSINGRIIVPTRGNAPLRVGTSNLESFFEGGIGKVALYDRELTADQIARHYEAMTGKKAG